MNLIKHIHVKHNGIPLVLRETLMGATWHQMTVDLLLRELQSLKGQNTAVTYSRDHPEAEASKLVAMVLQVIASSDLPMQLLREPPVPVTTGSPQGEAHRSQKDRCAKLAQTLPQGFTYCEEGRFGYIYYRAGDRVLELCWEMYDGEAYDIVVGADGLEYWAYPERARLTHNELAEVRSQFRAWLSRQTFKTNFQ